MSKILVTHAGTKVEVTEEQAKLIADKAQLIAITDDRGNTTYINPRSISEIKNPLPKHIQ